ncbi:hypothetical protein Tco_0596401 [Tanacetum coccineum]
MLPEWGRFVTAVKLNKGLKDSNFDQLYAYLKQHEAHANENKMMLERLTQQTVDPLALMSNVSPQHYHSQSSTIPPTTYHQPYCADTSQSDLGLSPTDNLIENLTNTLTLLTHDVIQKVQGLTEHKDRVKLGRLSLTELQRYATNVRTALNPIASTELRILKDKMLLDASSRELGSAWMKAVIVPKQ